MAEDLGYIDDPERQRFRNPEITLRQDRNYPRHGTAYVRCLTAADLITKSGEGFVVSTAELEEAVTMSLAYKEGFISGRLFNLEDQHNITFLQAMFVTGEEMTARPRSYDLDPAMEEATAGVVADLERYLTIPSLWAKVKLIAIKAAGFIGEEITSRLDIIRSEADILLESGISAELMRMYNHIVARRAIDEAVIQRINTCTDIGMAAKLLQGGRRNEIPVSPDKEHLRSFFVDDPDGELVSKVFREMIKVAYVPDVTIAGNKVPGYIEEGKMAKLETDGFKLEGVRMDIYARGMEDTEEFKRWLKHMVKIAGGKMDVVMRAWRFGLLTETFSELSKVKTKDGKIKLGPPPIKNDAFSWFDLGDKTAIEMGRNFDGRMAMANGESIAEKHKTQAEINISHTGLPYARVGTWGTMQRSYLRSVKVDWDGGKRTLFDIFYNDGNDGGIELSDVKFPWLKTENSIPGTGEPSHGSFETWLLNRMRAGIKVIADVRSRPSLRDLGDPDFFASRVRDWSKVFGPLGRIVKGKKESGYVEPQNSQRTKWVAALLAYHYPEARVPKDLKYTVAIESEMFFLDKEPATASKHFTIPDFLDSALFCKFLRVEDVLYILDTLNLDPKVQRIHIHPVTKIARVSKPEKYRKLIQNENR